MDDLLTKNKLRSYTDIAINIISYFYIQLDKEPPVWLKENELFKFKGIEILF